ncbi:hypothetical protein CIW83_05515 [Tissierella sp. P1]|uniref:hypothetical protein n=1 Tax=Tissierella sp. P1 TaxID=1280483 RepID=UPI000BA107A5|nr:hypothetical protein [Tissierella sp. P1]OZV13005.1 hypothetical protein CIW83_05515 [Tissierella sp. P1]
MSNVKEYVEYAEIIDVILPFDFNYLLKYYVIYPWINENNNLVRILEDNNGVVYKVTIYKSDKIENKLLLKIQSNSIIMEEDVHWIKKKISWCLGCQEDNNELKDIIKKDPILIAANQEKWGRRDKSSPTLFEGILNVICAQNIQFSRIYVMSYNLSRMFGKEILLPEGKYYSFPKENNIKDLPVEDIKKTKVGYRCKTIKESAIFLDENKITLERLNDYTNSEICEILEQIKGIGKYTSNLILNVVFRRFDIIHIDSFVRTILKTFYIETKDMNDEEIFSFCTDMWGKHSGKIISILTTDTDEWAKELGVEIKLKSGAHIKNKPTIC